MTNPNCKAWLAGHYICSCCGDNMEEDDLGPGMCEACQDAECEWEDENTVSCRDCGDEYPDTEIMLTNNDEAGEWCRKCYPRHNEDEFDKD